MFKKNVQKLLAQAYKTTASAINESPYIGASKDLNELIDNILFIIEKTENNGNT